MPLLAPGEVAALEALHSLLAHPDPAVRQQGKEAGLAALDAAEAPAMAVLHAVLLLAWDALPPGQQTLRIPGWRLIMAQLGALPRLAGVRLFVSELPRHRSRLPGCFADVIWQHPRGGRVEKLVFLRPEGADYVLTRHARYDEDPVTFG